MSMFYDFTSGAYVAIDVTVPYDEKDFEALSNNKPPSPPPRPPPSAPSTPNAPDVILQNFPSMTSNLPEFANNTQIVEGGVMTAYEVYIESQPSTLPINFTVNAQDTDRLEFRRKVGWHKMNPLAGPFHNRSSNRSSNCSCNRSTKFILVFGAPGCSA